MDPRRYLDLFLSEAREHLNAAYALQGHGLDIAAGPGPFDDLRRHVHSLKGMAATMGFGPMVSLAHAMEDGLERVREEDGRIAGGLSAHLRECLACLGSMLDRIEAGDPPDDPRAAALAAELARPRAERSRAPEEPATPDSRPPQGPSVEEPASPRPWRLRLRLDATGGASAESVVRLLREVAGLGHLVSADPPLPSRESGRFSGRLSLVLESARPRAEIERVLGAIDGVEGFQLEPAVRREPPPPAPLRPPRWIRVRADRLDDLIGDLLTLRGHQARLQAQIPADATAARQLLLRSELQLKKVFGAATALRMVPFDLVAQRVHRTVHEVAGALGKDVDFRIRGGDVCLDRTLLDALLDPLMHVVKNCLDHGLEPPAEREASGKPPRGVLRLELQRHADRVSVGIEDDGRGMIPDRLRRRAVELGLADRRTAEALGDREALMLTTIPGFTTATEAGHVSGRGIGLDVVHDALRKLGGALSIRSTPGVGARFELLLPAGPAWLRTLLVRSAGETYALPIDAVQRASDLPAAADPAVPRVLLRERLGLDPAAPAAAAALRILTGGATADLVVDELLGPRDVVVQPFQGPLTHLRPYSGAALLEDGSIALVLDPAALLP
jgi:two-component system chemotaxis sensor kinase CheA